MFLQRYAMILMLGVGALVAVADEAAKPNLWERAIANFEKEDRATPPGKGGVLFLGSSTIRGWKLDEFFPGLNALNRGFGGSTIADVNLFFDRVVTPYAPRTIVFYSGDNDIDMGATVDEVYAEFERFASRLHEILPETRLIVLGIKPSIARWDQWASMRTVNEKMAHYAESREWLTFVDTAAVTLGDDGQPRKEFFLRDGLHLNAKGYAAWSKLVHAALGEQP